MQVTNRGMPIPTSHASPEQKALSTARQSIAANSLASPTLDQTTSITSVRQHLDGKQLIAKIKELQITSKEIDSTLIEIENIREKLVEEYNQGNGAVLDKITGLEEKKNQLTERKESIEKELSHLQAEAKYLPKHITVVTKEKAADDDNELDFEVVPENQIVITDALGQIEEGNLDKLAFLNEHRYADAQLLAALQEQTKTLAFFLPSSTFYNRPFFPKTDVLIALLKGIEYQKEVEVAQKLLAGNYEIDEDIKRDLEHFLELAMNLEMLKKTVLDIHLIGEVYSAKDTAKIESALKQKLLSPDAFKQSFKATCNLFKNLEVDNNNIFNNGIELSPEGTISIKPDEYVDERKNRLMAKYLYSFKENLNSPEGKKYLQTLSTKDLIQIANGVMASEVSYNRNLTSSAQALYDRDIISHLNTAFDLISEELATRQASPEEVDLLKNLARTIQVFVSSNNSFADAASKITEDEAIDHLSTLCRQMNVVVDYGLDKVGKSIPQDCPFTPVYTANYRDSPKEAYQFFETEDGKLMIVAQASHNAQGFAGTSVGNVENPKEGSIQTIGTNLTMRKEALSEAYNNFLSSEEGKKYKKADVVLYGFGKHAGPMQHFAIEQIQKSSKKIDCLCPGAWDWILANDQATNLPQLSSEDQKRLSILDIVSPLDQGTKPGSSITHIYGTPSLLSAHREAKYAVQLPTSREYKPNVTNMLKAGWHERDTYTSKLKEDMKAMNRVLNLQKVQSSLQTAENSSIDLHVFDRLKAVPHIAYDNVELKAIHKQRKAKDKAKIFDQLLSDLQTQNQAPNRTHYNLTGVEIKMAMDHLSHMLKDPEKNSEGIAKAKALFTYLEQHPEIHTKEDWDNRNKGEPLGVLGKMLANRKDIQHFLSPGIKQLEGAIALTKDPIEKRKLEFELTKEKAKLCARFGYGFVETDAGANGARFIRFFDSKIFAVYKPVDPAREGFGNAVQAVKNVFGQMRLLNKGMKEAPQYAEVVAKRLDNTFGFDVAPLAEMMDFNDPKVLGNNAGSNLGLNKGGCIMEFLGGYTTVDVSKQKLQKDNFTPQELNIFQKLIVYDFLRGNLDGHDENIFVKLENGQLVDAKIIDGGNSFRQANPDFSQVTNADGLLDAVIKKTKNGFVRGNCYKWGELKIANKNFTPEMIQFIKGMDKQALEDFISSCEASFWKCSEREAAKGEDAKAKFADDRIRERFDVLKKGVATGRITTPKQLSSVISDAAHEVYTSANAGQRELPVEEQVDEYLLEKNFA